MSEFFVAKTEISCLNFSMCHALWYKGVMSNTLGNFMFMWSWGVTSTHWRFWILKYLQFVIKDISDSQIWQFKFQFTFRFMINSEVDLGLWITLWIIKVTPEALWQFKDNFNHPVNCCWQMRLQKKIDDIYTTLAPSSFCHVLCQKKEKHWRSWPHHPWQKDSGGSLICTSVMAWTNKSVCAKDDGVDQEAMIE